MPFGGRGEGKRGGQGKGGSYRGARRKGPGSAQWRAHGSVPVTAALDEDHSVAGVASTPPWLFNGGRVEAKYKMTSKWQPATIRQVRPDTHVVEVVFDDYSDVVQLPLRQLREPVPIAIPTCSTGLGADGLTAFLDQGSALGRRVASRMQTAGFIVLPGVFTGAEVDVQLDRMWSFVETVSRGVRRDQPSSWVADGTNDPWPCKQRDMFQLHQAGWLFCGLREQMAERVFEPVYGTRKLHCSKDGFTLQRPTTNPAGGATYWDHFDQGVSSVGLQCIQGSVALIDQQPDDGCFCCWPGSHQHREALMATMPRRKVSGDFVLVGDEQRDLLRQAGISRVRVPVKRGDVILWRSDLLHCGATPIGARPNFRAVVYICALPAALTPPHIAALKHHAYQNLETGSHWPCKEEWFVPDRRKLQKTRLHPFFRKPPPLTARQQELHGLLPYKSEPEPEADAEPEQEPELEPEPEPEPEPELDPKLESAGGRLEAVNVAPPPPPPEPEAELETETETEAEPR
eukprot:SAG11_NODE_1149_length_5682_cov_5.991401_3_plen_515_part_00